MECTTSRRVSAALALAAVCSALMSACGKSEKAADDVAAIRVIEEQRASEAASDQASSVAHIEEMKRKAALSAAKLGAKK